VKVYKFESGGLNPAGKQANTLVGAF